MFWALMQAMKGSAIKKAVKKNDLNRSQSKNTTIEDLPDSVLTSIFSLLPMKKRVRIERVNKRWQRLAVHHAWTNHKSLTLHFDESLPAMKNFKGSRVYSGDDDYAAVVHHWLYAILERCGPYLREITLFEPQIRLETFALLGLAPHVKHLDIRNYRSIDLPLSDAMLDEIGSSLGSGLKALQLQGMQITDANIRDFCRFTEKCPSLECLSLHGCTSVELEELFADGIDGSTFPQLKVLVLDLSFHALPLLAAIAKSAAQLVSFILLNDEDELHPSFENGDEELLSRRIVEQIGEMKGLKHLAVHSSYIDNGHIIDLLKTDEFGRKLESLELRVTSRELLDHVLTECPNLVHLAIKFMDSFEGPFTPAAGLRKLRYLKLEGEVIPGILTAMAQSIEALEFVDISKTISSRHGSIPIELRRLIRDCPTFNHVHMDTEGCSEGYTMIRLAIDERVRTEKSDCKWPLSTLQLCLDEIPSHLPQHPHIYITEWQPREHEVGRKKKEERDKRSAFHVEKCRMPELDSIKYGKDLSGEIPSFLTPRDCACGFC